MAFLCAEFGVHSSLPIYSGGLGVLAGDILKEASDMGLPMVGVGLLYQFGYFHQRTDPSGYQQEYWIESDPKRLPVVPVSGSDGRPLRVTVPVHDLELQVQVWRADIGRVPLYLLDTNLDENPPVGPVGDGTAVRRESCHPAGAVRACSASVASERFGRWASSRACTTSTRVTRRWVRSRCSDRSVADGPVVRRGVGRGAAAVRVHDPHPRASGQRDLPP